MKHHLLLSSPLLMILLSIMMIALSRGMEQVATCHFGEIPVDYHLHYEAWCKGTSLVPCSVWMIKSGFDLQKSMFESCVKDAVLDFSDAFSGLLKAGLYVCQLPGCSM